MSSAIASARQRRAGITPEVPPPSPAQNNSSARATGLTLPQVINLIDIRLMKMEKFVSDYNISGPPNVDVSNNSYAAAFSSEILEEYDQRFEMLANEIGSLKDIVLKLQSYTMDVNRILLEEKESKMANDREEKYGTEEKSENEDK